MRKLWRIAREEFKMTAANKAFVIITIICPLLIAAISVLPGLQAPSPTIPPETTIGVVGGSARLAADIEAKAAGENITVIPGRDAQLLMREVAEGRLQGLLVLPADYLKAGSFRYYSRSGGDPAVTHSLSKVIAQAVVSERLVRDGVDPSLITYLTSQPQLEVYRVSLSGKSESGANTDIYVTAIGFILILYMSVLLYGQMIARSVVGEKVSKTAEIMLSSVRPSELLFGKIFGKGLAGILQYAFWIGIALFLLQVVGPAVKIPPPQGFSLENLLYLALSFVLAFLLYSAAYGAIGAASQDEQHVAMLALPLLIFLILPLVTITLIIGNPSAPYSVALSYFPLTSPIVMLLRLLVEPPAAWQIALCVAILVITIIAFVLVAARIFRVGILMTGKRVNLGEIMHWVWE